MEKTKLDRGGVQEDSSLLAEARELNSIVMKYLILIALLTPIFYYKTDFTHNTKILSHNK